MKFGICCGINEAKAAIQAGFDYIEVGATGFDGLNEEWDPEPYVGHPVEVTNLFFPGSIRLVGPEASDYLFYAKHTIERAALIPQQMPNFMRSRPFALHGARFHRWPGLPSTAPKTSRRR